MSPRAKTNGSDLTEADLFRMLRDRHMRTGNGGAGEYAVLFHVRNGAGFDSTNTFDAVVMQLWPSRGLELHGYEVKCSRKDWQRELGKPEKAEAAAVLCDRFSIVVSDQDIIRPGELPPTWGLLVPRGGRLHCVRDAPLLPGKDLTSPVPRPFLVSLLRAAGAVPKAEPEEVTRARDEGLKTGLRQAEQAMEEWQRQAEDLRKVIRVFEEESGVTLLTWRNGIDQPAVVARTLRAILNGDAEARAEEARSRIRRVRQQLLDAAGALDPFVEETPRG